MTATPPDRLDRIEALILANAQGIADLRQEILDTHVQLSQAQASAWEAIGQTNRTVNQVNNSIFQLTQEVSRLRAGQEAGQRVLDYLLRQEQQRNRNTQDGN